MIGIFDSGLGGLTIVKEIFRQLPEYQIIYFGDTARTPYGSKSKETIVKYAAQATEFLISQGAKIIVVACNTASALAFDSLKDKFKIPLFEVVTPAVKQAIITTKNKKVGVIGTTATIMSKVYNRLINETEPQVRVFSQACPLLVPLVEENWITRPETKTIIKRYLEPLKLESIDTLILGCTHYPILAPPIKKEVGGKITLIDPAQATIAELKKYLDLNPGLAESLMESKNHKFFVSDLTPKFLEVSTNWLQLPLSPELVSLE